MSLPEQYSHVLKTGPAAELLTLAEAKTYLHIDHDAEDDEITQMIVEARKAVESFTSRQLITATWVLRMDQFVAVITPPRPKLLSVTTFAYVDSNGDSQTLTEGEDFDIDIYSTPGRIVPVYGGSWPSTRGHINDVTITHTAGYGATASTVPDDLRKAHKLLLGHYHEHREQWIAGESIAKFPTAEHLMWEYREGGKR